MTSKKLKSDLIDINYLINYILNGNEIKISEKSKDTIVLNSKTILNFKTSELIDIKNKMSDEQLSKILNTLSKDEDEMYFISKLKLLNEQELKVMSDMARELEKLEDEKNKIFETAFNKMKHLKKEK